MFLQMWSRCERSVQCRNDRQILFEIWQTEPLRTKTRKNEVYVCKPSEKKWLQNVMGAQNPSICFSPPPATHGAAVLHCTSVPGLVRAKLDLTKTNDNDCQTNVILLDFFKAFDNVPHKRLMLKIHHFWIGGTSQLDYRLFVSPNSGSYPWYGESNLGLHVQS